MIRINPIDLHVDVEVRWLKGSFGIITLIKAYNDEELASIISLLDRLTAQDMIAWEAGTAAIEAFIAWGERKQITHASDHGYPFEQAKEAIIRINSDCTRRGVTRKFDDDDDGAVASLWT